jgi:hypothetical protein
LVYTYLSIFMNCNVLRFLCTLGSNQLRVIELVSFLRYEYIQITFS